MKEEFRLLDGSTIMVVGDDDEQFKGMEPLPAELAAILQQEAEVSQEEAL